MAGVVQETKYHRVETKTRILLPPWISWTRATLDTVERGVVLSAPTRADRLPIRVDCFGAELLHVVGGYRSAPMCVELGIDLGAPALEVPKRAAFPIMKRITRTPDCFTASR